MAARVDAEHDVSYIVDWPHSSCVISEGLTTNLRMLG